MLLSAHAYRMMLLLHTAHFTSRQYTIPTTAEKRQRIQPARILELWDECSFATQGTTLRRMMSWQRALRRLILLLTQLEVTEKSLILIDQ
ncbi:uncharacterized protein TrAFT101_004087 [Trichoderma asperellum]|uniref:uncharacterized protein n=1 Tax=Trichoderma asperellum TaxID=101201 RepID=UPI00331724BB|nr:hypothetical protein TrAFT101_004087 [Trichoderma asperellum]